MIDRVVTDLGRRLVEVPVGFKWFVPGLGDGSIAFGGEESAGASFLCKDGSLWCTEKDGILLDLLAAEIMSVTGSSPSQLYARRPAGILATRQSWRGRAAGTAARPGPARPPRLAGLGSSTGDEVDSGLVRVRCLRGWLVSGCACGRGAHPGRRRHRLRGWQRPT
jgi:hypothetical protein